MATAAYDRTELVRICEAWLSSMETACAAGDSQRIAALLSEDCYWRDLLAATHDIRTFHGRSVAREQAALHIRPGMFRDLRLAEGSVRLVESGRRSPFIQAIFDFDSVDGHCRGVVRLSESQPGVWLAWSLLTALDDLTERPGEYDARRPVVTPLTRDLQLATGTNWARWREERRKAAESQRLDVVIVGAGHSGLAVAARLQALGVEPLVVERNSRVGDNWRKRYDSLILHDPVWANHLPFMSFPRTWPVYTPKDKLAQWFEAYVDALDINVWTSCELVGGSFDSASNSWRLHLRLNEGEASATQKTVECKHVVIAVGEFSKARVPQILGRADYEGVVLHSSEYLGGRAFAGQRAVVVGAGNSGLDIAEDLYYAGAEVTVLQRSSTYVMSQQHGIAAAVGSLYYEGGPPLDEADLLNASSPLSLVLEGAVEHVRAVADLDAEMLRGLNAVGFETDLGIDGRGLVSKAFIGGGGYYIDVGCSELIADRKITVSKGEISRFVTSGLLLTSGATLPADLVVLATGYEGMQSRMPDFFGQDVAARIGPIWYLDNEGEVNGLYRRFAQPGFWAIGGNLAQARIYSRHLALQIAAAAERARRMAVDCSSHTRRRRACERYRLAALGFLAKPIVGAWEWKTPPSIYTTSA